MTKEFVILHLSDAHIGNPKHKDDSLQVLAPLVEDLARVSSEHALTPSLIVFSGDLVFGKIPGASIGGQYLMAGEFINRIHEALHSDLRSIPILFVPGNHDIDRTQIDLAHTSWISGLRDGDIYEHMRDLSKTWKGIIARQREWSKFVKPFVHSSWHFDRDLLMTTGLLEHERHSVGIAGLNTAWACSGDEDYGRLWLGQLQLQRGLEACEKAEFKVVATHHPPGWLHHKEARLDHTIEASFNLYLHGHLHEQWFSDRLGHLRVDAGPCYEGSLKRNGYSWICVDFERRRARLILREYTSAGSGGWGPKYIPDKTDHDGIGLAEGLFGRSSGTGEAVPQTVTGERVTRPDLLSASSPKPFKELKRADEFIKVLQDNCWFRWEPHSFQTGNAPILVYWPVRLRRPTPIHAVQCFVAAGLQKLGAKVILCLDDLGNVDTTAEKFDHRIRRWLKAAGGESQDLDIQCLTGIITRDNSQQVWGAVHDWLGKTPMLLGGVLEISKLLPRPAESARLDDLLQKRPRRLLTPALVWAGVAHFQTSNSESRFLTLGGYDEQLLWKAWRDLADISNSRVGHLYVPELLNSANGEQNTALYMAETNLAWASKDDILKAFREELGLSEGNNWQNNPNHLIAWCFLGCSFLPSYVSGEAGGLGVGSLTINSLEDFKLLGNPAYIVEPLADKVAQWIL